MRLHYANTVEHMVTGEKLGKEKCYLQDFNLPEVASVRCSFYSCVHDVDTRFVNDDFIKNEMYVSQSKHRQLSTHTIATTSHLCYIQALQ